jgi:phosphopantetheinyl transferase (holo-ACP synthase)
MIGNDVVDLLDPAVQPGATHPRFDERVFTPEEREAIAASGAPNRLRWMLWAAKEAAFKVARKLDPRAVFSPARFAVALESTLRGVVRHGERRIAVRIHEDAAAIHAVAASDGASLARVRAEVVALPEPDRGGSASAVRSLAIGEIARAMGAPPGDLEIVKQDRIPHLLLRGEQSGVDLSLSHHGRLVAFACEVEPGDLRP